MREGVGDLVARVVPLPDLGPVELEHLGRRIGDDELVRVVGQQAGPLAGAGGKLEDAAARREGAQARRGSRSACGGERVILRGGEVSSYSAARAR